MESESEEAGSEITEDFSRLVYGEGGVSVIRGEVCVRGGRGLCQRGRGLCQRGRGLCQRG